MTICLNSPSVTFPGPCPRHGPGNVTFFISKLLSEVLTAACNFGQEIFCSLLWSYPLCMARSDTWRNKKRYQGPRAKKIGSETLVLQVWRPWSYSSELSINILEKRCFEVVLARPGQAEWMKGSQSLWKRPQTFHWYTWFILNSF